MITPMNKYTFILHYADSEPFLEKIQGLGLVDIVRGQKAIDEPSKEMHQLLLRYKSASKLLLAQKPEAQTADSEVDARQVNPAALLADIENAALRKEQIESQKPTLRKEMEAAAPWGPFNPSDREKIQALGYTLHAYSVSEKRFDPLWRERYPLFEMNSTNGTLYFIVLQEHDTPYTFPLSEIKFPDRDIRALEAQWRTLEDETEQIDRYITSLQYGIDLFQTQIEYLQSELDRYLAGKSVQKEAEDYINILTGFAPKSNGEEIAHFLDSESMVYLEQEAVAEDTPPIKLKNNWFTRQYEAIGALYVLPKYGELDLTPYFAPFYMLFFGLCLGDMGYGLLILTAGIAVKRFVPALRGYASLVQMLGIGAVLMAALTGGFFGIDLSQATFLSDSVKSLFLGDIQMFWFAILFGVFQILFARIVQIISAIRRDGWLPSIANIGWTLFISWCVYAYASTQVDSLFSISLYTHIAWLGGSLAMILLFTKTKGNIFKRIGSGAASLFDITGVFGDILSYVRLFGLGTAGAILGLVVNNLAMSMAGSIVGWFFALVLLLIGHTLVLLLSCLGAFVHPLRLTFVEFYKNAGFTGGGRPFRPLTKTVNQ